MLTRLLTLAVLAGCSREIAGGQADGPKIFAESCAACHGATGKPDRGMVVRYNVRDLTAPEFRGRVTVELVASQVRSGSANKIMPAFAGSLTEAQILAVSRFVTDQLR
jgi:mono/diheme cytochrome c family protein